MERLLSGIVKGRASPASTRFDSVAVGAFRSFVAVVETGGFSAAARRLGLAVSTVSKHVDALEDRLRRPLTLRTTRRVAITEFGRTFYEQCAEMLDKLDQATEVGHSPHELSGRLSIIAPPSFARCVLAPALPRFLSRHPRLGVDVRVTPAPINFLRDGIDLAIRTTKAQAGGDRIEYVGPAPSLLCASPEYLARHGMPRRPEDLAEHRCLGGLNSPYGEHWPFRVGTATQTVPIRSVMASDMGDVLREACLSGTGIAGFYEFHVRDDLKSGRLLAVLGEFQADVSALYVVLPGARYTRPKTAAFLSFLTEVARDEHVGGVRANMSAQPGERPGIRR